MLEVLRDGQLRTMREVTDLLAAHFHLTEADRLVTLKSGRQSLFYNRVAWAKAHMMNAGLIDNPKRGEVRVSEEGASVLAASPASINCRFLRRYPAYLEFIGQSGAQTSDDGAGDEQPVERAPEQTPGELIDSSFDALNNATIEELVSKLKSCTPTFFEHIVVRLLRAMGYGGTTGDGRVTQASADGGIDGIIKEDKLGLDVVCIQAKRWENAVGRPVVQAFVGSMDYIRARKGVILTTSQFTKEALEFVNRIEGKKVVLINGRRLAELMIEHNVGVNVTKVYELKEVSNDFFDEDLTITA